MISYRNGFTSFANFFVLLCALYLFAAVPCDRVQQFQYLTLVCLPLGSAASLFYLYHIREQKLEQIAIEQDRRYQEVQMVQLQNVSHAGSTTIDTSYRKRKRGSLPDSGQLSKEDNGQRVKDWKGWLGMPVFYLNGIVYMLVRISVNVTMTIQPFYLELVPFFCSTPDEPTSRALALVPLISYTAQIVFSILLQPVMNDRLKSVTSQMVLAIIIMKTGSYPLAFMHDGNKRLVYYFAAVQGVGHLIMLNTATVLISDVIGDDTEQSAFVYGVYSFLDKLANGLILFYIVQNYSSDPFMLKWIMALTPPICTILAFVFTQIGLRYSRK